MPYIDKKKVAGKRTERILMDCPPDIWTVTLHLLRILVRTEVPWDSSPSIDKVLILEYWRHFDRIDLIGQEGWWNTEHWFRSEATDPALIIRAKEWLVSHNILVLDGTAPGAPPEAEPGV